MKRVQVVAIAVILVVLGFVLFLALRTRQPPVLPGDAKHAVYDGAASCLTCHGPQGVKPRSKNHPMGNECLRCHGGP